MSQLHLNDESSCEISFFAYDYKFFQYFLMGRVFQIALRGREIRNFSGGVFLLGEGNLTKSDSEP